MIEEAQVVEEVKEEKEVKSTPKIELVLNKAYIVVEDGKIFTIKILNYSKSKSFVQFENQKNKEIEWRIISDFNNKIIVLDEYEEIITQSNNIPTSSLLPNPFNYNPYNPYGTVFSPYLMKYSNLNNK